MEEITYLRRHNTSIRQNAKGEVKGINIIGFQRWLRSPWASGHLKIY